MIELDIYLPVQNFIAAITKNIGISLTASSFILFSFCVGLTPIKGVSILKMQFWNDHELFAYLACNFTIALSANPQMRVYLLVHLLIC